MIHLGIGLGVQYGSAAGALSQPNPIAVARINAIYAAGGSCPVGQATATSLLSDFINAEQSSGRWAQHRNIFIPGWGNAAANAIGIVTGGSGSFSVSGVTHGAGFVQGDGTSGFFNFLQNPASLGITLASGMVFALISQAATAGSRAHVASSNSPINNQYFGLSSFGGGANLGYINADTTNATGRTEFLQSTVNQRGIIIGSRVSGTAFIRQHLSSGNTQLVSETESNTGVIPNQNIYAMAANAGGTAQGFSNARYGAYGVGLGLTTSEALAFSNNLRDLWQGLFQLSLPS